MLRNVGVVDMFEMIEVREKGVDRDGMVVRGARSSII